MATPGMLKPFRHPRRWLGLWLAAVTTVIVLSLVPPPPLPPLPSGSDKLEHFSAYFLLAAGAVQLFARPRVVCACGLALVLMGVALEFAQGAYTSTRMQDGWDAVANSIGVIAGIATVLTPWRDALLRWQRR
ncbi:hypothetical protein [Pseudoxanthomonas dokdonensis]|uniref:Membrane protein n=1 Tax=Pseudoxanthomonas dokdonensis TaxID=344882 RepID=A0A0R0CF07_9GAMM|nr:hypothetical protein [Pseudoxanthomonas dokdonensis]KRG68381.1 membrane protein [Pseudoxanthomonas dokdonensis]